MRLKIKRVRVRASRKNLNPFLKDLVESVGDKFVEECKREINEQLIRSRVPSLSPVTIARKGHDKILYETGKLVDSYNKRRYGYVLVRVGVFKPDVASYAIVHEYGAIRHSGTKVIVIPPRPVLRYLASEYVFMPRILSPVLLDIKDKYT